MRNETVCNLQGFVALKNFFKRILGKFSERDVPLVIEAAGDDGSVKKDGALVENSVACSASPRFSRSAWPGESGIPVQVNSFVNGNALLTGGKFRQKNLCVEIFGQSLDDKVIPSIIVFF